MSSKKQVAAARQNVKAAQRAATSKKTISNLPKSTRTALGKQGAAVGQRKRTGGTAPKSRVELLRDRQASRSARTLQDGSGRAGQGIG
jgi:hypothetical protein